MLKNLKLSYFNIRNGLGQYMTNLRPSHTTNDMGFNSRVQCFLVFL